MKKSSKSFFKFITITIFLISIIFLSSYMYLRNTIYSRDNIDFSQAEEEKKDDIDKSFNGIKNDKNPINEKISIANEGAMDVQEPYEEKVGITNVLLIGTDGRNEKENSRSDSIIIATMDTTHKKIKFTSIMRDTYVRIKGHGEDKINSAFSYGGPKLLIDTIYKNFNIKIDKYIVVNFWGFQDIVNELGGIDINIKNYEIKEINKYIGEVDAVKSPELTRAGMQHLDGQQALAYSRIRKVGNGSYERTQRQRTVMTEIGKRLMNINPIQYPGMLKTILPYIRTNIEPLQLMNYAYTAYCMNDINYEGLQLPANELSEGRIYKGTWVFLIDREQNAKMLNEFIFEDKQYSPKNYDRKQVQWIMQQYINKE